MKKGTLALLMIFLINIGHSQTELSSKGDHKIAHTKITPNYLTGEEKRAAEIYKRVSPTSVIIFTSQYKLTEKGVSKQEALGSGVLVSKKGHILTAAHVVDNADKIVVKTHDGELREAELVFSEPEADIALIRLKTPDPALKYAVVGNSDSLAVGQRTYVIGNPYGFENSFSVGRISAFRDFGQLYDGSILAEFIQTDAAINSGNSGGGMFNSKGEVIGISSQIISVSGGFQGLGMVIAINTAKQLLALEDRVWMGFGAIFLAKEELGLLMNLDLEGGLLVQTVVKGGPAEKAGLERGVMPIKLLGQEVLLGGDLIIQVGDQETCHSGCLANAKEKLKNQKEVKVKVLRKGKIMDLTIEVSTLPTFLLK